MAGFELTDQHCPLLRNSGSPRMLLRVVLVREFESRRGEILISFAKIKKGSTAESA